MSFSLLFIPHKSVFPCDLLFAYPYSVNIALPTVIIPQICTYFINKLLLINAIPFQKMFHFMYPVLPRFPYTSRIMQPNHVPHIPQQYAVQAYFNFLFMSFACNGQSNIFNGCMKYPLHPPIPSPTPIYNNSSLDMIQLISNFQTPENTWSCPVWL